MSFSASSIKNLNRSMRANQDIQIGTFLSKLHDFTSASGNMALQDYTNVNITGGTITNAVVSGSFAGTVFSASAKLGIGADYTNFENDGTMRMSGSATTWDDLRFPATAINPAGFPSPMTFDPVNIGWLANASGSQVIGVIAQLPHSWKEGSTIEPHIHWEATTTTSASVLWRMQYKWTNRFSQEDVSYAVSDLLVITSGSSYYHDVTDFPFISGSGKTISSIITIILSRVGNDPTDTYNASVLLKEFDIHYEQDSVGSHANHVK